MSRTNESSSHPDARTGARIILVASAPGLLQAMRQTLLARFRFAFFTLAMSPSSASDLVRLGRFDFVLVIASAQNGSVGEREVATLRERCARLAHPCRVLDVPSLEVLQAAVERATLPRK